jgi:hypothetical protein
MCYAVQCLTCGKTTWAGCGLHVESVKHSVPAAQWCEGHPQATSADTCTSFSQNRSRRKRSKE